MVLELVAIDAFAGGGGGGLDGGGGDLKLLSVRAFIRDDMDEDEIDDEDVVETPPIVVVVALVFMAPLSKGLTRSCGSKLVTGLYLDSCSYVSKTLEEGLLLELTLPAVSVEVDEVSERASTGFSAGLAIG